MGKSLIQTANQTTQTLAENSVIGLGTVIRRYGCNLRLSGNGIEVNGEGYYKIDCNVTAAPTAAGNVTVALYDNGVQVPGAIATATTTAADQSVTLPIETTIRQGCRCEGADNLVVMLTEGAGDVTNISLRVEKS